VKRYRIFTAVAIAGIGDLPDTTQDRSIQIPMIRKLKTERTERFHIERTAEEAEPLRRRLAAWAWRNREKLAASEPEIPAQLDDRAAEIWEPLLAIADLAGGEWPERARQAALMLSGPDRISTDSVGVQLLADLCQLWCENAWADFTPTNTILGALIRMEDREWATYRKDILSIDSNGLATLLRRYRVVPDQHRVPGIKHPVRGYWKTDLEPLWAAYVPDGSPARDTRDTRYRTHTPWPGHTRPVTGVTGVTGGDRVEGVQCPTPVVDGVIQWGPNGEIDL
jgi:hypothetical protein